MINQDILKEGAGRLLFDSAAEGLLVVDHTGSILIANHQLEEMFGYDAGELIGQRIEVLIPYHHRQAHQKHREEFAERPRMRSMGRNMDLSAVRKDGSEFPVEVSLTPMKVDDNLLVMGLVTDISDRKRAEAALHELNLSLEQKVEERTEALIESQHLYRTIARNFPNGTINVFDRDLNYVFSEGQELFRLRLTSDHLVGTNYLDRLPSKVRETIEPRLRDVFEGKNMSFEVDARGANYMLNAVALRDSTGQISQILVVEQNITQQKKAQKQIEEALKKERELNELKSRFVSMASHEFRTPLATILTSVTLLKRYNETDAVDKRMKHLNRIRTSVQNLTTILNDFLSLDKLEEGVVEAKISEVKVHELVQDIAEEMGTLCKEGQQIEVDVAPYTMTTDEHILRNALINLLSNAIKYSPVGCKVQVYSHFQDGKYAISVADEGIGIPLNEQEHLFSRFFRASNATNIQGTGLGLHIVIRYLQLLNGRLSFVSTPGEGTTFTVKFE